MPLPYKQPEMEYVDNQTAFNSVMEWYNEVKLPPTAAPSLNRMRAITHTLALCKVLREPEIAEAFAGLPERYFDGAIIERLYPLALAMTHQANVMSDQKALSTNARLPTDLVNEASSLRNRLYSLIQYYLGEDATIAAKLASIKSHTGYIDMANDLARLANIVEDHRDLLKQDNIKYTPTCVEDARRCQQLILSTFSMVNQSKKQNTVLYNRLWNIMYFYYTEICTTGSWIFRRTLNADRFASLTTLMRNTSKAKDEDEDENATDEEMAEVENALNGDDAAKTEA